MSSFRDRADRVLRSVWAGRAAALILAGVFLWAGIAKAMRREDFFNAIGHYHLLSVNAAYRLSLWIPWIEIALAVAVIFPIRLIRRAAAVLLGVMLVFFTAGLLSLWLRGRHENCGCFGGLGQSNPAWSVLRNLVLISLAWLSWRMGRCAPNLRPSRQAPACQWSREAAG